MDDRSGLRRAILLTLLGFIVLLYLLGAASVWARRRFLNDGTGVLPAQGSEELQVCEFCDGPPIEQTARPLPQMCFDKETCGRIMSWRAVAQHRTAQYAVEG